MEPGSWEASSLYCNLSHDTFTYSSSGVDAAIKLRPCEDEVHELGPEFQSRWRDFFANKPDKPVVWMKGSPRHASYYLGQMVESQYPFLDFQLLTYRSNWVYRPLNL